MVVSAGGQVADSAGLICYTSLQHMTKSPRYIEPGMLTVKIFGDLDIGRY